MDKNMNEVCKEEDLFDAIANAEKLFFSDRFDECNAAFQALYDRYSRQDDRLSIVRSWNECLKDMIYESDQQHRYSEMQNLCVKNIELLEEFPEELYAELLSAQNNYACSLKELGKYEQATECFKKTIEKCVEKYGQNGHNTLIAIGNMAGALSDFEMMPAAIQSRTRAVNGFLKLHGKHNPDYMRELVNLAEDYFFYGNMGKALKFITRAYKLRRKTLGEKECHTVNALNLLGSYYKSIMQYSEAINIYQKAVQLTETDDFYSLIYVVQMAKCYAETNRNEAAMEALNSISKKVSECDLDKNELLGQREYVYSLIDLNNRNFTAAKAHAENAVKLELKDNESALTSKRFLAEVLFFSADYDEADKLIEEIRDRYLNRKNSAVLCLYFECLYADIKVAMCDFRHSEEALVKASLIAGQCKFEAAGFMIASSKSFAAYCKLDMESFEKYSDIAFSYAHSGVDRESMRVRWLEQLG